MSNFTSFVVVLALLGGAVSGLRAQTISGDLVVAVIDQSNLPGFAERLWIWYKQTRTYVRAHKPMNSVCISSVN